jgi:GT2 family glycosyltransferase
LRTETVELSIIIVNWNTGNLLRQCLASLEANPPSVHYEVIVVDNASSDESIAFLNHATAVFCPTRLICNAQNVGFARANNQAIYQSQAPWLFLLNPDTEVRSGAVDRLLALLQSDSRIGACAPRLLNLDNTLQPNVWRMPPTVATILAEGTGLIYLLPKRLRACWLFGPHWDHAERRPVEAFRGVAMMVSRKMIEAVGAFDEHFELFGEDCEWCVRMGRQGWLLYFEPAAEVLHYGNQSALKRWTPDNVRLKEFEGQIVFQQRVLPLFKFVLNQLAYLTVFTGLIGWRWLRRKPIALLCTLWRLEWRYVRQALLHWLGGKAVSQAA